MYGDLAAVILRVHRIQRNRYPTTIPLPLHEDIPRFFAARFAYGWQFRSDEPLLRQVADWIVQNSPDVVDSDLLRMEISRQASRP